MNEEADLGSKIDPLKALLRKTMTNSELHPIVPQVVNRM
jgi:hypothetical protein